MRFGQYHSIRTTYVSLVLLTALCGHFRPLCAQIPAGAGLVAAYSFDEGAGSVTADDSGNGATGDIHSATWTGSSRYGTALVFDGASSFVDLGRRSALAISGSMTLSAWVYASGHPFDDGQIVARSTDNSGWQLKTTADTGRRTFAITVSRSGGSQTQRYSNTQVELNTWYYVAGVYDAAARTLDIYVNGVLDDGVLNGAVPASQTVAGVNAAVGMRSGGYYFNGTIDEVRMYNVALTAEQIRADMAVSIRGNGQTELDTIAPSVPGNLSAVASASQVDLSWTASTDNVAVAGYRIYRNGSLVASTTGLFYSDTAVVPFTAYSYTVAAFDNTGNQSPQSEPVSIITTGTATADTGLLAAWAFEEGAGTVAGDSSGNGNLGVIVDAAWGAGKYGKGLSFNGSSSYVDLGSPSSTGSMTVSAWVYATAHPSDDGQIVARSTDNSGWQFKTTPDTGRRTFAIAVTPPGGRLTQRNSSTIVALNTWYHVAGVYNAAARTLDIYVNGVLDNGILSGTVPASQDIPATNTTAGRRSGGYYFEGTIDEVRIYNVPLSAVQIQADLATPVAGPGTTPPADTLPPTIPVNVTSSEVGATRAVISWDASTDDVGVAGYHIRRDGVVIATTTQTLYVDAALASSVTYAYTVSSFDAAGNESAPNDPPLSITTLPGPAPVVYPLSVSANRRYLVDRSGQPFLMLGDSPQALIANMSEEEAAFYFANRQAKGFNTVWINLLCNHGTGGRADGSTYDGIRPFTTANDLGSPNEAYFARADRIIELAAQYGFLVLLDPIETIGWLDVLRANGAVKARQYGEYVGQRYSRFDNIIWLNGNDFQTWRNTTDDALVRTVALGIAATDSRHLQTVELNYWVSNSLDDSSWAPLISLNAAYTYYSTYAEVLDAYNHPNTMPVFMVEANYEFEHDYETPLTLRRQEYWTMLSGATGQLYGSAFTWQLPEGWERELDTTGAAQIGYVKALFEPRRWYDLVPDQDHTFVTGGYGTYSEGSGVNENDYVTAAATWDGTLAMAYVPEGGRITVQMSKLAGEVTAQWYDPANGSFVTVPGSPFSNTGARQFSTPGSNSAGDNDWVLILEAHGR